MESGERLEKEKHSSKMIPFDTGVTKPEIVKLMAVNGTTGLIHWTHAAPRAAGFSYIITKTDSDPLKVDQPGVDSVLFTDLVPEKTYIVQVSAYIRYNGRVFQQDSEPKRLKMLPKGHTPIEFYD